MPTSLFIAPSLFIILAEFCQPPRLFCPPFLFETRKYKLKVSIIRHLLVQIKHKIHRQRLLELVFLTWLCWIWTSKSLLAFSYWFKKIIVFLSEFSLKLREQLLLKDLQLISSCINCLDLITQLLENFEENGRTIYIWQYYKCILYYALAFLSFHQHV